MPINRNTLLRCKTIDRMFRRGRKATLEELIDACNDALYETNGYGEGRAVIISSCACMPWIHHRKTVRNGACES
jgi:hypothetical protein